MLPVAIYPSEAQAIAMESLVIKFANPECNNRDQGYQRRGARQGTLLVPRREAGRRRPPPRLRRPKQAQSIWASQVFQAAKERSDGE
eukprot:5631875-Pyramimonas_sp.AAC.1